MEKKLLHQCASEKVQLYDHDKKITFNKTKQQAFSETNRYSLPLRKRKL